MKSSQVVQMKKNVESFCIRNYFTLLCITFLHNFYLYMTIKEYKLLYLISTAKQHSSDGRGVQNTTKTHSNLKRTDSCCRFLCCWAFSWVLFYSQYSVNRGFAVHLVNVWPPQSALHTLYFFLSSFTFALSCSCSIIIIVIFWLINGNVLFMLEITCLCAMLWVPVSRCHRPFSVRMFYTHTNYHITKITLFNCKT